MVINKIKVKDAKEFSEKYCLNLKGFNKDIFIEEIKELKNNIKFHNLKNSNAIYYRKLLDRWYFSIDKRSTEPDYNVYLDILLLPEIWVCWILFSRNYIRYLNVKISNGKILKDNFGNVNRILDIGNGIGYSTAALKEMFPKAEVLGYNIKNSFQDKICKLVAKDYNFKMKYNLKNIGKVDLLFASEYFEHFEEPIKHLDEVLKFTNPENIIVANSFGTEAIGHFKMYKFDKLYFKGSIISRYFNRFLCSRRYIKQVTNCWNNRPQYWKKSNIKSLLF